MVHVQELLEYNHIVRHRYFESFVKLSWAQFTENREASFNSIRNIFVHTLGAIDYWLDFLQDEHLSSERKFDEYNSLDDVRLYMEHVEQRMSDYLRALSPAGLSKGYKVTGDEHEVMTVTAEDILIHVFEEEVHHRGELIALFWQMGVDPPPMGWKGL
jgi:uncharacterized damage-inducible protein DinB